MVADFRASVSGAVTHPSKENRLVFVFDTCCMPVTFDCVWGFACADRYRLQQGLSDIHLVIVDDDPLLRYRNDTKAEIVGPELQRQRIRDIIIAAADLFDSITMVTHLTDRCELAVLLGHDPKVFPIDYDVRAGRLNKIDPGAYYSIFKLSREEEFRPALRQSKAGTELAKRWMQGQGISRPIVSLTMRGYGHSPQRDSDLASWLRLAEDLDSAGYEPVFVPDTWSIFSPETDFGQWHALDAAAWNLALRSGLYAVSLLNLSTSSGPSSLHHLDPGCCYITFKVVVESVDVSSSHFLKARGLDLENGYIFATEFQELAAGSDDYPNLKTRTFAMLRRLEESRP